MKPLIRSKLSEFFDAYVEPVGEPNAIMSDLSSDLDELVERLQRLRESNNPVLRNWGCVAHALKQADRTHKAWFFVMETLSRSDPAIEPVVRAMMLCAQSVCDQEK